MNSRNKIIAITNIRKSFWFLKPRFLNMRIKNRFSFAIKYTSRNNISFYITSFIFKIKNFIFNFFYYFVFFNRITHVIIQFRERLIFIFTSYFRFGLEFSDYAFLFIIILDYSFLILLAFISVNFFIFFWLFFLFFSISWWGFDFLFG